MARSTCEDNTHGDSQKWLSARKCMGCHSAQFSFARLPHGFFTPFKTLHATTRFPCPPTNPLCLAGSRVYLSLGGWVGDLYTPAPYPNGTSLSSNRPLITCEGLGVSFAWWWGRPCTPAPFPYNTCPPFTREDLSYSIRDNTRGIPWGASS